jgi:hypothetical protein
LNFEWWIEDDVEFWILDFGFNSEFRIQNLKFSLGVRVFRRWF